MVLPVYDLNPVRRAPWVTWLLITGNIGIFLLTPAVTAVGVGTVSLAELCDLAAFYDRYAAIPQELITNEPLARVATGEVSRGQCGTGPPSYRKLPVLSMGASIFLHGGWLHLLGNLLFLWVFGNNVEERLGHFRFLIFYLVAGYVAGYGFALADPTSTVPLVGASGAVSGVLGAYLLLYPRAEVWSLVPALLFIPLRLPAWLVLGLWFALQWAYSAGYAAPGGSVAYLAHVIGFGFGLLVALLLRLSDARRRRRRRRSPWG